MSDPYVRGVRRIVNVFGGVGLLLAALFGLALLLT